MPQRLTPVELSRALSDLPDVHRGSAGQLQIRLELPSFPLAVQLIGLVGDTAEKLDHHPDVDLRWRTVTFGLSTHSVGGITELDLDLARQILEHGSALAATPLPPLDRVEIAVDAADPDAIRKFWQVGLGYVERVNDAGDRELHHPEAAGAVVWFQQMDPPRTGRSRMHLDVYLPADAAERRVTETLTAGGRLVTAEHAPNWWVLADAEDNELCICTQ